MIYGYARPLYHDLKLEEQYEQLKSHCDEIYQEAHGSPKKRVQLEELLMRIEPGDSIVVTKMAALADTFHHLIDLLLLCDKDKVKIHFLEEDIESDKLLQIHLKDMMKHIIQFQSDIIKQSTTIGMEKAKKSGKPIGRPRKSDDNIQKAIAMYHEGYKLFDIKNETGISKSTLYRYLEALEEE